MINIKLVYLIALLGILVISYGLFNTVTSDYENPDMKGYIIHISSTEQTNNDINGPILVEGIMGDNNQSTRVSVTINKNTHIFKQHNNESHSTTFAELKTGQNVEIKFTGPILESYPAQATANRIVILE